MNKQEDFKNRALAKLLTERGVPADYEQRQGRKKIDVVATVEGLRVALEAETGFNRKAQAIKDADARLRQKLATVVFAVCYPSDVTEENLAEKTLTWTVRVKAGESKAVWTTGSVTQLAQAVQQAPRSLSKTDVAAQMLSEKLDAAVNLLAKSTRKALAQALDLPPTKRSADGRDLYLVAAKRGLLVVATAMLFHHRVQSHLPDERPEGYDGEWPPASIMVCVEQTAPISAFREAWRGILAVDYRPIFETGRTAMEVLALDTNAVQAVHGLADTVSRLTQLVVGLRHDLLGRIFHRVLDTARYDGSYYTSTAAAVLLAALAIREEDADWSDPNAIAALRICDPACGTGTLLMAAAERIRDLRNAAGSTSAEDEELLGVHLVEDVLFGYDINLTATHMAASTLGMLSPSTRFHRMNVHRALLGVVEGETYLGSLDFLHSQPRLAAWPSLTQQVESEEGIAEAPPPMDLVIMNPPFTRDSLRHDQFSPAEEQAIKRREKEILAGKTFRRAARLSGSANAFLVLGETMVRDNSGILAVVLPTVMATSPGAAETRKYLAEEFHIDTIVSSHDPSRINMSENTSIGEILLICRRWPTGDTAPPKPPTRVLNMATNPATPLDSLGTAARIEQATQDSGQTPRDFTIQYVDSARIGGGDWFAVNFLSPYLVEAWRTQTETQQGSVPVVPLSDLAVIGPAGQRIRDAYTNSTLPTASGRKALWHHKTDITQTMRAETDLYIEPKPTRRKLADSYWEQRSEFLLPHRIRLNVARVAAIMLPERAVGSIWTPCRPHDPDLAKVLCLYLNSTPGVLSLLGGRDNRVPSYPSFSLDTLRSLPVPNFAELDVDARAKLSETFDSLQKETLMSLPYMHKDPVRKQIDDAVTSALGLDPEWVATVRRELAREPSVHDGKPR